MELNHNKRTGKEWLRVWHRKNNVAYVGTYTHENSVGIHIYDVDVTKGYMTERKVVPINNPSDLVVSKNRNSFILLQMKVWKLSKF